MLEGNEQPIKSYRIRVQRPKFPWGILLIAILFGAPALTGLTLFIESLPRMVKVREPIVESEEMRDGPDLRPSASPSGEHPLQSPDGTSPSYAPKSDGSEGDRRPLSDPPTSPSTPEEPRTLSPSPDRSTDPNVPAPEPIKNQFTLGFGQLRPSEPTLLAAASTDSAETRYEEHYEYERREPDNPWIVLAIWVILAAGATVAGFIFFRQRGHTFLYLTNRRLIVLELSEGLWAKEQTVLNFNIRDISGFQLLAQRGLRKLLGVLLLRDKRTFYLSIATRTSCNVEIGAMSARRSRFEPGGDAVALCGELDAQVLALRGGLGS